MIDTPIPTTQPAIEQLEDQPNLLMGLIGGASRCWLAPSLGAQLLTSPNIRSAGWPLASVFWSV